MAAPLRSQLRVSAARPARRALVNSRERVNGEEKEAGAGAGEEGREPRLYFRGRRLLFPSRLARFTCSLKLSPSLRRVLY